MIGSPRLRGAADHGAVRRANLSAVLQTLRHGPRTRASLARETALTKGTISSLVSELSARGLVRGHEPARLGGVGRPGQHVELVGERVAALGIELNVDYLVAAVVSLTGEQRAVRRQAYDVRASVEETVEQAAALLAETAAEARSGTDGLLAGVGVAAPGLVDLATGVVRFAPNLGWRDVPLRELVHQRLRDLASCWQVIGAAAPDLAVYVDNEANLATLAEYATIPSHDDRDLVYVTGGVGVGAGLVVDGRVVRGSAGFAGEVGHLAIASDGERCGCGRRGCWETLCGLSALLRLAADPPDLIHDHDRDLDERLAILVDRARAGDRRTRQAFAAVGRWLGHGASMLVNLVNPRVLVFGGYFARVADQLRPHVEAELAERVVAPDLGGCRVEFSRLGLAAAATGAAYAALQPVVDDPALVPYTDRDVSAAAGSAGTSGGQVRTPAEGRSDERLHTHP